MSDDVTNILVVDDLPEKLIVYRSILEELGQNLVVARSGEEALGQVLRHDFAVILLDVNMPGMDGFETAALIRNRRKSAHTPIIFLTAFADEVRAAEGYALGAVDYMTTPVVPAILRAKVQVFVDLYRMTQQVKRQAEERIALMEERTKREAVEEANRSLVFLARVGSVIVQSLDQEVTARDILSLPIPFLADSVILMMACDDGAPLIYRSQLIDDEIVVEEGIAPERLEPGELAAALDTLAGRPPPHGAGPTPQLALPLIARARTIGAIVFSFTPLRMITPAILAVAQSFASRSAIVLDNMRLYRAVKTADRQKHEFLSMLAHELRNPLAPIHNAAQMLKLQADDPNRVRWAGEVIDRQCAHMVRLVDDLLDVSRITEGKISLQFELVELNKIVTAAIEASRPLIDKAHHHFELQPHPQPVWVNGDAARLTQVVSNLLNNAAKYTENGGTIRLSVAVEDGTAVLRVSDTGIGISSDLLASIFDLFTQANRSLDRAQGGLGIGLTLVKRMVEMHGGSIQVHSEGLGRGSEFIVRLPIANATREPHSEMANRPPSSGPLRLVLVDDHADGVESLADLLQLVGHEVSVAYDGPTGIALSQRTRPDVVVLDIGLPGMDGYEVARRLRSDPCTCTATLIAMSGYGREEDRANSREAGFNYHVVKPVVLDVLQQLLSSIPRPGQ